MRINRNIGTLDRILRTGISLAMIYYGFIDTAWLADTLATTLLGAIGVASLLVALIGYCPLYKLIGVNTCNSACQE